VSRDVRRNNGATRACATWARPLGQQPGEPDGRCGGHWTPVGRRRYGRRPTRPRACGIKYNMWYDVRYVAVRQNGRRGKTRRACGRGKTPIGNKYEMLCDDDKSRSVVAATREHGAGVAAT